MNVSLHTNRDDSDRNKVRLPSGVITVESRRTRTRLAPTHKPQFLHHTSDGTVMPLREADKRNMLVRILNSELGIAEVGW